VFSDGIRGQSNMQQQKTQEWKMREETTEAENAGERTTES